MALRALLNFASVYLRRIRRLPLPTYRLPRPQLPRLLINNAATNAIRNSRISSYLTYFANPTSLVNSVYRAVTGSSTHARANSLLRAYSGIAGSVHLRHDLHQSALGSIPALNRLYERRENNGWFGDFLSSIGRFPSLPNLILQPPPLLPKELIGVGCNSAVWAAELVTDDAETDAHTSANNQLAVKVLYNYYNNSTSDPDHSTHSAQSEPLVDCLLLHRQLERECGLRPPYGHPNIVPLVGHYLDRAPADRTEQSSDPTAMLPISHSSDDLLQPQLRSIGSRDWMGANEFPEGFGGQPLTYYLLMPRYEATLQDLFDETWNPTDQSISNVESNDKKNFVTSLVQADGVPSKPSHLHTADPISLPSAADAAPPNVLNIEEAVAVLAQLFDAVAELERLGIAHRDIKPNNVLLRHRAPPPESVSILGKLLPHGSQAVGNATPTTVRPSSPMHETRIHAALTDFGCAIQTTAPLNTYNSVILPLMKFLGFPPQSSLSPDLLTHSGNTLLLAPEVTTLTLHRSSMDQLDPTCYTKSDLWAVATLAYNLFGQANPFTSGLLESATYDENQLPGLSEHVPGVVSWTIRECLRRDPNLRPRADLVADVLHTWCLLHTSYRPRKLSKLADGTSSVELENDAHLFDLNQLPVLAASGDLDVSSTDSMQNLINVFWAADWLSGASRLPSGLRVSFYRRITVARLALCLRIVHREESARAYRIASRISVNLQFTT